MNKFYKEICLEEQEFILNGDINVKTYVKYSGFLYDAGYEVEEKYELHFDDGIDYAVLLNGIHTTVFKYQDELKYEEAKKQYYGEVNYTCIDNELTIKKVESVDYVGSNYSKKTDVDNYLAKSGYQEVG